jgi:O-antigen/teichoic acid export membrane protein
MGLPVSLILIAVGAILAFAVNQDPDPAVDIDVVGWVLMLVGLAGLLLSLLWWERWGPGYWGWRRGPYEPGASAPRRSGYPRRRTVVEEEEEPPPPSGPPGPPPP